MNKVTKVTKEKKVIMMTIVRKWDKSYRRKKEEKSDESIKSDKSEQRHKSDKKDKRPSAQILIFLSFPT